MDTNQKLNLIDRVMNSWNNPDISGIVTDQYYLDSLNEFYSDPRQTSQDESVASVMSEIDTSWASSNTQ